ncbi:MAG: A/G-specific adenine glycosylase [Desulfovibrionaceae bacterium]
MTRATIPPMRQALHTWFALHQRPLPWRRDYSPYAVWISEIMLQQTQMERGVSYFERWMQRFPNIAAVAAAPEEDILHQWEGLGYYSRARNLHKAARIIIDRHHGLFPSALNDIRALPGIGPYTAGAIASIAFGADTACIDANVERVIARVFDIDTPLKQEPAASRVRKLAKALLPKGQARMHNQAMMELGALVCRKKALCEMCPLQTMCQSHYLNITHERPVRGKSTPTTSLMVVTGILHHNNAYFMQKRLATGVWGKLWEFPGGRIEEGESPEQALVREFMEETGFAVRVKEKLGIIRHGYTTYRIKLHCFSLELQDSSTPDKPTPPVLTAASEYRWLHPPDMTRLGMPAAHRKLADQVFGAYAEKA